MLTTLFDFECTDIDDRSFATVRSRESIVGEMNLSEQFYTKIDRTTYGSIVMLFSKMSLQLENNKLNML